MDDGSVKDRLVGSALTLFVEEGYDAVSVEKVREAARVSNGSFFHLFGSKTDLAAEVLVACVVDYQASIIASLARAQSAADGVEAIISTHLRWVQKNRAKARFMLDEARSAWFARAAAQLKDQNRQHLKAIERWRMPLLERGELRPLPIEVFSATLIGPANLLCRMWLTDLKPSAVPPIRHEKALVELALHALIPGWTGAPR
jgi:AcrR family transcriptional regulator